MKGLPHLGNVLDAEGRATRWPTKHKEKELLLDFLASKFQPNQDYSEIEVNAILKRWHTFSDWALLRRELVVTQRLNRTSDCQRYWKALLEAT